MKQTRSKYPVSQQYTGRPANDAVASKPQIIHLRDGEVVLYKRERSRKWQARFKLFSRTWRRVATGHISLEYAIRAACEAYDEARFRERLGLPQTTRRFDVVARATVPPQCDGLTGSNAHLATDKAPDFVAISQ